MGTGFKWWYEDDRQFHIWKKLNSLTPSERESKHQRVCEEMVQKYGNIYFYKPHPHQLPVHSDAAKLINIHGQNSSGKSYNAGAFVSEEVVGWSQYRDVKLPPFGIKKIWVVTTSYQIQLNSSQSILFSNEFAPVKDVGLLPSLSTIEAQGGLVVWEKGKRAGILKRVVLPNQAVEIEFKSMESGSFSMAGGAVDVIWPDEVPPKNIFNELVTRALRKGGRLIMSYLVGGEPVNKKIPGQWVVDELYPNHLEDIEKTGHSESSFYFFTVDQNVSLDPQEVKASKSLITSSDLAWRFSEGGKFNIQVHGTRVYDPYEPTIHLREDLVSAFDEFNVLYRAWDLGYARPACTAFQVDKYNRVRIMFSILGEQEVLNDFIPRVERKTLELFPSATVFHECLPHDARRKYDTSPKSSEMIFNDNGLNRYTVIYIHAEDAILDFNKYLQRLIHGEPAILVDMQHAPKTVSCMQLYIRNPDTGEPFKDKYYEHLSDNLKMIAAFLKREGVLDEHMARYEIHPPEPFYPSSREPSYGE